MTFGNWLVNDTSFCRRMQCSCDIVFVGTQFSRITLLWKTVSFIVLVVIDTCKLLKSLSVVEERMRFGECFFTLVGDIEGHPAT